MADIKQRILDFYKVAQTKGHAMNYQWRVLDITDKGAPIFTQDQLVYCTSGSVPGKRINPVSVPYSNFEFNVPGGVQYNDTTGYALNFYLDENSSARIAIENWIERTFDEQTTTGDHTIHANSIITLAQLDKGFNVIRTYQLIGIFPIEAGNIEYTLSDSTGSVVTFTATFAYQFFRRDNEINQALNTIGSLL
jgi:hypothetical protein